MRGALVAVGAAGFAWLCARLWRIAEVGAAYKAKILASALFGSGLPLDPNSAPEVSAEAYWILRLFHAEADREAKSVTVSLLGLRPRTAVFRPGLGATLALGGRPLGTSEPRPAAVAPEPWPEGRGTPALGKVLERSFAETDPKKLRRTRAVLVAVDGKLVAERYAEGIGPSTPLAGWSMAKSVLSALVGICVREGRLSLPQTSLLTEWSGPGDPRAKISLEDLLRMRSGLAFEEDYSNPLSDVVQMLFARPDAGGYAASRPLAAPPGTAWKYSSGTTNILSLVLKRLLGPEAYAAFPRRALFDPLGMTTAVFEPDASGTFVASSFLLASAQDWARLGQLYLQDGVWKGKRLLPEGWVGFSTKPTPQAPEGRFGAHWWLKCPEELGGKTSAGRSLPADAFYAIGHEGQVLTVVPSRRLVAVRLGLAIRIDAWDHAAFLSELLSAV